MTEDRKTAVALLEGAGFTILREFANDSLITGIHGNIEAEPYDCHPDRFIPKTRTVFVGKCAGGFYATSHIRGMMRRYRCRKIDEVEIANIFAGGKTETAAVQKFLSKFTANPKRYNTSWRTP